MIGRNRRGNRQANMKARIGIATAVLVGGSAVGVAAVAAASHGTATPTKAQSAGFSHNFNHRDSAGFTLNFHHRISEQVALASALNTWGRSQQQSFSTLAQMQPMRAFSQVWNHRTQFAAQRGIVVLATRKFLLVKSANGSLHLWWLNGHTVFKNVSSSAMGMTAMTGNVNAAQAAMLANNMNPATITMAGNTGVVNQMTTPVARPTTVTVSTGNVTVNVTITSTTATVTLPVFTPAVVMNANLTTFNQSSSRMWTGRQWTFTRWRGVQRGDLALVAGIRKHGFLIAKLVLFAAPTTVMPTTPTVTPTVTPTTIPTGVQPTATSTAVFGGTHS